MRLGVVSALAEGADRLVIDEVFDHAAERGEEARLEVVLPFDRERYTELQGFSAAAEAEFEMWLSRASSLTELGGPWVPKTPEAAYEAAGQHVVARCDVLVAVWDGRPARGRGGTAEILLYAAEMGKPCIWVPLDGNVARPDNLAGGSEAVFRNEIRRRTAKDEHTGGQTVDLNLGGTEVLGPLQEAFRELDEFNRAPLPPAAALRRRAEQELGPLDESSDWIVWPFMRAARLADRFQSRFMRATWLMAALGTGAAAALGASVTQEHPSAVWGWAEVACLLALIAVFAAVHRAGLHRRWLSYRLLAERFRTAFFIASTGIDFRRTAGLEAVFVERHASDWLLRAFEEVWDSRPEATSPQRALSDSDVDDLRHWIADRWLGGQIAYHEKARRHHERRGLVLTWLIVACFIGTVGFATAHASTTAAEEVSVLFTITLPVAAAAIGVVLTVRQHHALAERYGRMHADLVGVRRSLLEVDAQTIRKATSEAARVIAEENGDWLGAMWFLDVEHPP